ncbi:MAG: hypothetical protein ABIO99_08345 [Candidatus Limnocylindria bacterium]
MTRPIQPPMTDQRLDRLVTQLLTERAEDVAAAALSSDAIAERIAVRLRPSPIGHRWVLLAAAVLLVALAAGAVAVGSGLLRIVRLPDPVPTVEPHSFAGVMASTGAMTVARLNPTAIALLDGRVLVAGGSASSDGADRPLRSAEIWDPATGRFAPVGPPTWLRVPHAAVLLEDGRVLFVGEGAVEIFDPTTNAFTTGGAEMRRPPTEESGHAATRLPDGRVLVTGGDSLAMNPTAEVDIVDPESGEFTTLPPLARPTSGHEMAVLPDGRVLLFGANIGCCEEPRVEIYDPATGRSELAGHWPGNPTCTCPDRMVLLGDGRLLILQEVMPQRYQPLPANAYETLIWDPVTDTAMSGLPIARQDDTNVVNIRHLLLLTDGRLIVVGSDGYNANPDIDWVGVLDPMSGSLERLSSPTGVQTTVVQLPDGGVLFLGGTALCTAAEVGPPGCVGEPTNTADLLR